MILTCPQCATRYQVDAAKFPAAGRNVRCAKCGTVWHQLGPAPEPDSDADLVIREPMPTRQPTAPVPAPMHEPAPVAPRVAAFAPAAAVDIAAEPSDFAASPQPGASWLGRIALGAGWLLLVGLVAGIGWAAVNFRDTVTLLVPKTSSFYAAAGFKVNRSGIDFTNVAYHQKSEGGQRVLTVTARIVNNSTHEQTVPSVRVTLLDVDGRKLATENFVASVLTLKSGGVSDFQARIASPPPDMKNVEVGFARAGE